MAEQLSQEFAEYLIGMEKHVSEDALYEIPESDKVQIPLTSVDGSEFFILDIEKGGRINIKRGKLQNRVRQNIVLLRLDFGGAAPHDNPDGARVDSPHLHIYKEGWADKWAYPVPGVFDNFDDFWHVLENFMRYCNITKPPRIKQGLFK